MSTYTLASPCSWAVSALALASGSFRSDSANAFEFSGSGNFTPSGSGSVGELIVVTIVNGGSAVTPPTGWTTMPTASGSGSGAVLVSMFYKVATSSDLTGPNTFSTTGTADGEVLSISSPGSVRGTAQNGSASDSATATGPTAPTYSSFILEGIGRRGSVNVDSSDVTAAGGGVNGTYSVGDYYYTSSAPPHPKVVIGRVVAF